MSAFELAAKGKRCPFFGGQSDCRELVTNGTCEDTWLHIQGQNPLTGEVVNKWDCAYRVGWIFSANAERRAHEAAADVLNLRNMIFDADYRKRELERAYHEAPKAIEGQ